MHWDDIYFHNTVRDWVIALSIIIGLLLVMRILRVVGLKKLKTWADTTDSKTDDFAVRILGRTILPLLYLGACYLGLTYLHFPVKVHRVLNVAFMVASTFFVLRLISGVIHFALFRAIRHHKNRESKEKQLRGILFIINVVVWILGLVFLLSNLGYNITAVITGLGVGGIAIALASQVVLGDLFSYFVIFFDRPFEIGDAIAVDDKSGTVEYIGIKTTRLRALSGEQLIFSNTNLTNSRVHNYKRMDTRRIQFSLGVSYQVTSEQIKKIPALVKDIISKHDNVRFDRGHFSGFGQSSLNFEFVYFITTADYVMYMDRQQSIYLNIFETFEREGIDFAYPTQEIFVKMPGVPVEDRELRKRVPR